MTDAAGYYQQLISETEKSLRITARKAGNMYLYRLIAFMMVFASIWIFRFNLGLNIIVPVVFLMAFLWLVKKNIQLERLKSRLDVRLRILQREVQVLNLDFLSFPDGKEFVDPQHPYTHDLDIFGNGSVYQYINRTTTSGGSQALAHWFKYRLPDPVQITVRQDSVRELARLRDWRLEFLMEGNLTHVSDGEISAITGHLPEIFSPKKLQLITQASRLLPLATLASLLYFAVGGTHLVLLLFLMGNFTLLFSNRKIIQSYYDLFGNKSELIHKFFRLLQIIESGPFESSELSQNQSVLTYPAKASENINQLKNAMSRFEYRANLLVGITLNALFLWDLHCVLKLRKWHLANGEEMKYWLDTISFFDALVSLGIFADNNPDDVFPEPVEGNFLLEARNLGHPLLSPGKRVTNDFSISGCPKIVIITGANMAGKSTFLRTAGLCMVLAQAGAPVCASSMRFTPADIFTSMRTTDSLLKEESYFLAELKRIAAIMEKLRNGETMLVILDEMLKGTNSEDKLKGSVELIRQLIQTRVSAIIATHDVKLTETEKELPGFVANYCFEIDHVGDDMIFDYKLRTGVTKTMNASLLMKKMGIIP